MTSMTEEQRYNGWRNYPTWNVNLWLSNDEAMYDASRELVVSAISVADKYASETTRAAYVADVLRDWVRDNLAPDLGASFAADLLGYALDQVDWLEIAEVWIVDVTQQTPYDEQDTDEA